jgi:glutathione S-transferase
MITLYQLHWSHFVEKVRWALDYKGLEWTAVDVDPFTKREMRHLKCALPLESGGKAYIVPAISDAGTGAVTADSSKILDYLERTYPTPALYPEDVADRSEVTRWMLWLDSTVGLLARRLAYTQIALEHPAYLASLFLPGVAGAADPATLKARVGGTVIAGVLSRRFRFAHNRADGVYEELERCLLIAAGRLSSRRFLVAERFTAADLTLAALMRPAVLVPYFRDHSRLQSLWEWRQRLLQEHRREAEVGYEKAMGEVRRRRGWALGRVGWLGETGQGGEALAEDIPTIAVARNDQQVIGRWPMVRGPFWYLGLKATCGLKRLAHR